MECQQLDFGQKCTVTAMGKNARLATVEGQDKNVGHMDARPQLTRNLKRRLGILLEIATLMHRCVIGGTRVVLMDSPFRTKWTSRAVARAMAMKAQTLIVQGSN
jgi:hypothetical protein